jgi:hypothetical protein
LKYPPFPWAQNFQDGAHQTTGAQRKIFEKGTIFFGHPVQFATYILTWVIAGHKQASNIMSLAAQNQTPTKIIEHQNSR